MTPLNTPSHELVLIIAVRACLLGLVAALETYLDRRHGWTPKKPN